MSVRFLSVFLFIVSVIPVIAQNIVPQTNDEDNFYIRMEAAGAPYFYEPANKLNGWNVSGTTEAGMVMPPFGYGVLFDFDYNSVYGGVVGAATSIQTGSWMVMHLDAFLMYSFSKYISMKVGVGGAWDTGSFSYDAFAVLPQYVFPYSRSGVSTFLDATIDPGIGWYDVTILNTLDIFNADVVYYGGFRNNFHLLNHLLDFTIEAGITRWIPDITALGNVNVSDWCFIAKIGVAIIISPLRWGENGTARDDISTDSVNTAKAEEQINQLNQAKTGDIITFTNIIFFPDQAKIKAESFPVLEQIALFLKNNSDVIIELRGYTNYLGSPDQELELSKARAEAVKDFILSKGISSYRMVTIGYGSLFARNNDIQEANRKVEIRIVFR